MAGGALPFRVAGKDGPGCAGLFFLAFSARTVTSPFRFKADARARRNRLTLVIRP